MVETVTKEEEACEKKPVDHYNPTVRSLVIQKLINGSCGFNLSRSKWDPYPWVSLLILFLSIITFKTGSNSRPSIFIPGESRRQRVTRRNYRIEGWRLCAGGQWIFFFDTLLSGSNQHHTIYSLSITFEYVYLFIVFLFYGAKC